MKTFIETIRLAAVFAIISFGIVTMLKVTSPEPTNSSTIEYDGY
jgi:hypothetical protein